MIKECLLSFFLCVGSIAVQADDVLLQADFNKGIPAGFELINNNNLSVKQADFKKLSPKDTWFAADVYGTDGSAAVSVSRRIPAESATDNWLILPQLHITSENCWLSWNARSMHHDLLESYNVMVSVGSMSDFQPLYIVEDESYGWKKRVQSLSAYVGQDIYIAFCHNSTNRFALAVDDILVGELTEYAVEGHNKSPRFVGSTDVVNLQFTCKNLGRQLDVQNALLTIEGGEVYKQAMQPGLVATDVSVTVQFELPVKLNQDYAYKFQFEMTDGTIVDVLNDFLVCSHYPRTVLVEKFTGVWCNNCPSAIPFINKVKERFGSDVAVVEVHGYNKQVDPMSCDQYGYSIPANQYGYPTVAFNRNWSQALSGNFGSMKVLEEVMKTPTEAMVKATARFVEEGMIEVNALSQFASDLDNSSERYRIGVIVKEKHLGEEANAYFQANNCTLLMDEEFAYMPGGLTGGLVFFHDVARGCNTEDEVKAMGIVNGIKGTLPAEIKAATDYKSTINIALPASVQNREKLALIIVLFNNMNVMNVAVINEIEDPYSSIQAGIQKQEEAIRLVSSGEGRQKILFPANASYVVSLFTLDGTCIAVYRGNGNECLLYENLKPGCYLVRASQSAEVATYKFIVNKK